MQCPAIVSGVTNRVDSLGLLRAGFTPSNFGSSLPIQTNSFPRPSRDFYFAFREIEPASRLSRAGLTLLSRSCP
jgi:hypothetical protein